MERLLALGEKGKHRCDVCLELFDFTGNGKWIPTTCPDCVDKKILIIMGATDADTCHRCCQPLEPGGIKELCENCLEMSLFEEISELLRNST